MFAFVVNIDPVIFYVGALPVRWYGLAYSLGLIIALYYWKARVACFPSFTKQNAEDFILWAMGGIVIGGRLGYVFFYRPWFYLSHPLEIVCVWKAGMSFPGGLVGAGVAALLFCRLKNLPFFSFVDWTSGGVPPGLFLGRLANFINQELWGRPTTMPWGVVFSRVDDVPRHPSQLYEGLCEGLFLFIVLYFLSRTALRHRQGALTGCFLVGYGLCRMGAEFFREPDFFLGFFLRYFTMGQLLSLPLVVVGGVVVLRAFFLPLSQPSRSLSKELHGA